MAHPRTAGEGHLHHMGLALPIVHTIALTGASGYIASHVAVALADAGFQTVGIDNLSNSSIKCIAAIESITGTGFDFVEADLRDQETVTKTLANHNVDAVIHLAGLKAVGESVSEPLRYYDNNLAGTISLLNSMKECSVDALVFSSSATVYRPDQPSPLREQAELGPINPYGRNKMVIESMIDDVAATSPLSAVHLRYFNPIGAHPSGKIGEDPVGVPNNLMPFVMQVAAGRRPELQIFGNDYPTPDGTCIRDYIHVCDLAEGHVAALDVLENLGSSEAINLGTGVGSSVFEVIRAAEAAVGARIPHRVVDRRDGDAAVCFADPGYAEQRMSWKARHTLETACADHWRWQQQNPGGYEPPSHPPLTES